MPCEAHHCDCQRQCARAVQKTYRAGSLDAVVSLGSAALGVHDDAKHRALLIGSRGQGLAGDEWAVVVARGSHLVPVRLVGGARAAVVDRAADLLVVRHAVEHTSAVEAQHHVAPLHGARDRL